MFKLVPSTTQQRGVPSTVIYQTLGIYHQKLSRWVKSGLITPSIQRGKGGRLPNGEYSKSLFSLEDMIELKTITALLDQGMSLQKIRKVLEHISERGYSLSQVEWLTDGNMFFIKDLESDGKVVEIGNTAQFVLLDWRYIVQWSLKKFNRDSVEVE